MKGRLAALFALVALGACGTGDRASSSGEPPAPIAAPPDATSAVDVAFEHFRMHLDGAHGGQIASIDVWDGVAFRRVAGAGGRAFPALSITTGEGAYAMARADDTRVEIVESRPDFMRVRAVGSPRAEDGRVSPIEVTLDYTIHREGAVFVDIAVVLARGEIAMRSAEISFALDDAVVAGSKVRDEIVTSSALPSARIAYGADPAGTFTNELEVLVEDAPALGIGTDFTSVKGRYAWNLAAGVAPLRAPSRWEAHLALGIGAGARARLVGQRAYQWVGWDEARKGGKDWYPTDLEIDRMAESGATMLLLHNFWMAEAGVNGSPHADYRRARDEDALRRVVAHAHARGLRVGLYVRAIERYALDAGFFTKYLERDRDGLYLDWHGPHAIAAHEHDRRADLERGDRHFTDDGHRLPLREYFSFVKTLRDAVGPRGFIVAHQGSFTSGVFADLGVDGHVAGEPSFDHAMLASLDEAAYRGMMGGGGATMAWPVDAPGTFTSREGMAKMAAWGIVPDVPLGIYGFPNDPTAPQNQYAAAYFRVLAAGRAEQGRVFGAPGAAKVAATSSSPSVRAVVYVKDDGGALVVASNVSPADASATLTLHTDALGLSGAYDVARIDATTGATQPIGTTTSTIDTGALGAWDIAGFVLTRR